MIFFEFWMYLFEVWIDWGSSFSSLLWLLFWRHVSSWCVGVAHPYRGPKASQPEGLATKYIHIFITWSNWNVAAFCSSNVAGKYPVVFLWHVAFKSMWLLIQLFGMAAFCFFFYSYGGFQSRSTCLHLMGFVGARSQKFNPSFLNKTMERTSKTSPSAKFSLCPYRGIATPMLVLDFDSSVGLPRSLVKVSSCFFPWWLHSKIVCGWQWVVAIYTRCVVKGHCLCLSPVWGGEPLPCRGCWIWDISCRWNPLVSVNIWCLLFGNEFILAGRWQ